MSQYKIHASLPKVYLSEGEAIDLLQEKVDRRLGEGNVDMKRHLRPDVPENSPVFRRQGGYFSERAFKDGDGILTGHMNELSVSIKNIPPAKCHAGMSHAITHGGLDWDQIIAYHQFVTGVGDFWVNNGFPVILQNRDVGPSYGVPSIFLGWEASISDNPNLIIRTPEVWFLSEKSHKTPNLEFLFSLEAPHGHKER
jgi:hypothetical protein